MALLNTGVTAIAAAQLGLATTQHNIANANTPGYSRQAIVQATNIGLMTGAGSVGQGVHVSTIMRSYSSVMNSQLISAQSQSSQLDTYHSMIVRIDNLLADANSGFSPVLADFFKGVQDVAANPTLISARESMMSAASAMATRFQTLEGRLTQLYDETNIQISDTVDVINNYSAQVAALNEKIMQVSNGLAQPPNDLLDQRDQLILELGKLVRVNTVLDSQGNLNVFVGQGQQLVVGNQTVQLEARSSAVDLERMVVYVKGSKAEFPEEYMTGGTLGGLFSFRKEALDTTANTMGQLAASLALTINAQQQLGQDLLGQIEGDTEFVSEIFKLSSPKFNESTKNSGTGSVDVFEFLPPELSSAGNFYTDLSFSDYEVRFTAAGTFDVMRLSDRKVMVAGGSEGTEYNFDGLKLQLSAGHNAGDVYMLQPTREIARNISVNQEVAGDVRRIAAATPVRTIPGQENTGTAILSQGEVKPGYNMNSISIAPVPPDTVQGLKLTIEDDGSGGLQINGFPGGPVAYNAATNFEFDGFSFSLSSGAKANDVFFIQPNVNGVADARNAVKIGALQTALTMGGDGSVGVATFQVSYAQLVSDVGTKTKTAQINGEAQKTLLQQTQQSRDALAGVNLDEEAANLIRYQQSYQAAARVMDTVSKLFDTLLSIGR